jgi:hypothetical protein
MWVFTTFADGLEAVLAPTSRAETDAAGHVQPPSTVRRRTGHASYSQASNSLLLGHHAFTAFASLLRPAEVTAVTNDEGAVHQADGATVATHSAAAPPHGLSTGSASFRVVSADPTSPVLVGVCGENIDLGTPLSWEEDHCFVVECSHRGAFLWSDRGMTWGKRLSEKCFNPIIRPDSRDVDMEPLNGETLHTSALHEARFDFSWTPAEVCVTMASTGECAAFSRPSVADIQGHTVECEAPPSLAPCATFFGDGVEVTVF